MDRNKFLRTLMAAMPVTFIGMKLNALNSIVGSLENTPKMPVLFLGHGSPMNAIEDNEFVQGSRKVSSEIETPKAIVCISAHWETSGTQVTAMETPPTIHDFGGFPQALYNVQYPAPGNSILANKLKELVTSTTIQLDENWGLDHGAWSVIKHMYPKANVPVIQLSLDYRKSPQEHYELAKELSSLREKGVLIVGSGNIIHNLGRIAWDKIGEAYAYDWAEEVRSMTNEFIQDKNHEELINYKKQGRAFELAIPTPEHFLPLLYALALQNKKDDISLFNDQPIGGSLSMTSVKIG